MSGFAASLPRVRRKRRRRRRPSPGEYVMTLMALYGIYLLLSNAVHFWTDAAISDKLWDLLGVAFVSWILRWRPSGLRPSYLDYLRTFWRECVRGTDEPDG